MLRTSLEFIVKETGNMGFGITDIRPLSRPKKRRSIIPKIILALIAILILLKKFNRLKI